MRGSVRQPTRHFQLMRRHSQGKHRALFENIRKGFGLNRLVLTAERLIVMAGEVGRWPLIAIGAAEGRKEQSIARIGATWGDDLWRMSLLEPKMFVIQLPTDTSHIDAV